MMHLIDDVLISDDVLTSSFACHIPSCQGACCWEGDFGAPLDPEEVKTLERLLPDIRSYLSPAGLAVLDREGTSVYYPDLGKEGTPLIDGGACAYLTLDSHGIAHCGIETAWEAGVTSFRKPISCHLYPIRVLGKPEDGYEALNYDRWSICAAACTRGQQEGIRLVEFAKEALIRKYGEAFYEALVDAADRRWKEE